MRRYYIPVAVLGLGSLALLVASERGRQGVRWLTRQFGDVPDKLLDFNQRVQFEIERLQLAVDELDQSLQQTARQ